MIPNVENFEGINCTINTTENCNLRCKYCYETNKTSKSISYTSCARFIDLILKNFTKENDPFGFKREGREDLLWIYNGLIMDFIGGDSLIDPDLLDKILTYLSYTFPFYRENFPWGWRASICSNGTLFENPKVREFCEKWKNNLSLTVSIDGCPEIHDMNRVFPDGTGSMSKILKWYPWYRQTFPESSLSTKATCARDSIPYLYDSLRFMHEELGLKYINQNFIMEDTGCTEEDYKLLDKQLEKCCQYVLDRRNEMYWSMLEYKDFTREGNDLLRKDHPFDKSSRCGSGCMPCLSIDGSIYPCFRWLPASQNGKSNIMCIGDIHSGLSNLENFSKVYMGAIRSNCTKEEKCRTCEYEPGCAYCIAGCYAENGDFIRTTHICEITKLQYKWAEYYWREYERLEGRKPFTE